MNKAYSSEETNINYAELLCACSRCDKRGINIIIDGYCHADMDGNGICMECYKEFKLINASQRFKSEWIGKPRPLDLEIHE